MRIRIDDITKGTFRLPTPIDTRDQHLQIGVKSIGCWVGFYNVHEEQTCQWRRTGGDSTEFKINPGFYSFKDLSKVLKRQVSGLNISLNKITGLINLSVPANIELWLTESIKNMIGLDDTGWLQENYEGDRPLEILPAGGIFIYLDELSTTNNLSTTKSKNIINSNLLCNIPMLSGTFGQYFSIHYDNPMFLDLGEGEINQLEFRLKMQWGNGEQYKLNNLLPISLELEIK